MNKRVLIGGFSALLIAGIGVSSAWVLMARGTEQVIADFFWIQPAHGEFSQTGQIHMSGFPFRVSARIEDPAFEANGGTNFDSGIDLGIDHWQAAEITAEYFLFAPRRVKFSAPGHIIGLQADWAGPNGVVVDAVEAWLEVHRTKADEIDEFTLSVKGLATQFNEDRTLRAGTITLDFKQRDPGDDRASNDTADTLIRLDMTSLELPIDLAGPLAATIDHMEIDLAIAGNLATGTLTKAELDHWRRQGGFIQLRSLKFDLGDLSIDANGRVELDEDLQPVGRFETNTEGLSEFFAQLESTGLVDPEKIMMANLVVLGLNALGGNRNASDENQISLPITLHDNGFYLGPIKLIEFDRLDWVE